MAEVPGLGLLAVQGQEIPRPGQPVMQVLLRKPHHRLEFLSQLPQSEVHVPELLLLQVGGVHQAAVGLLEGRHVGKRQQPLSFVWADFQQHLLRGTVIRL
ncbi:hypothetical protein [Deinococcus fonticola]|uniref:hypothetical protein n=1 Tax=Deinococcus fonticola TaxID=2528713 RepID=UPI001431A480|nr:hypothetical protein [Deinococcus fonticola]